MRKKHKADSRRKTEDIGQESRKEKKTSESLIWKMKEKEITQNPWKPSEKEKNIRQEPKYQTKTTERQVRTKKPNGASTIKK